MIDFKCSCGHPLEADDRFAGRRKKCPACRKSVRIPGQAHVPPAAVSPARARKQASDPAGRWQWVAGVLILATLVTPWAPSFDTPHLGVTLLAGDDVSFNGKLYLVFLWSLGGLSLWSLTLDSEASRAKACLLLGSIGGAALFLGVALVGVPPPAGASARLAETFWQFMCVLGSAVLLTFLIVCPLTRRFGRRTPIAIRIVQALAGGFIALGGAALLEVSLRVKAWSNAAGAIILLLIGTGYLVAGGLGTVGAVAPRHRILSLWAQRVLVVVLIGVPALLMAMSMEAMAAFPLLNIIALAVAMLLLFGVGLTRLLAGALERWLYEGPDGGRVARSRRRGPAGIR